MRKFAVALPSSEIFGFFDLNKSMACLNSDEPGGRPMIATSYASRTMTRQPGAGENDWNNWSEESAELEAAIWGILLARTVLSGQQ